MSRHLNVLMLASVAVLASCERDALVAPRAPPEPLMEIADARDPGRAHFYFLPPMALQPEYAGVFDASVLSHVTVDVCELLGTECGATVASFTAAGRGLKRVSASEHFEHYLSIWRTDGRDVIPGKTYRVVVSAAGTALGHADVKIVRTAAEAELVDRTQYAVWAKPIPLPIRFRVEKGGVFPVGAAGGIVTAGAVRLEFPADAVSGVIGVTVAAATGLPPDPAPIAGTAFDFGPDGAQFAKPVKLSISYDQAAVPADVDEGSLRLHKLTDGAWMEVAGSAVDVDANTVSGEINSFSVFGVLPARPDPSALGQIAFVSGRDGNNEIYLMSENGSDQVNLTNHPASDGNPVWSQTGDKLAFLRDQAVFVGATGTASMISNLGDRAEGPSWTSAGDVFFRATTPTGRVVRIEIVSGVFMNLPWDKSCIFIHPSSGGAAQEWWPCTDEPLLCCGAGPGGPGAPLAPLVSPKGTYVAARHGGINPDYQPLEVYRRDSREQLADPGLWAIAGDVTSLSYNVGSYAWSPVDPTKIAFVMTGFAHIASVDRVDVNAVVLADVATQTAVRLYDIPASGFGIGQLVWSPDGNMLAVECETAAADEICVLDLSVSPRVLTNVTNNSGWDRSPTWSPDGKKIAFVSDRDGDDEIYVMDANGANVKRLTTNPASDGSPRWRP